MVSRAFAVLLPGLLLLLCQCAPSGGTGEEGVPVPGSADTEGGSTSRSPADGYFRPLQAPPLLVREIEVSTELTLVSDLPVPVRVDTLLASVGDTLTPGDSILVGRDLLAEADLMRLQSEIELAEAMALQSEAFGDTTAATAESIDSLLDLRELLQQQLDYSVVLSDLGEEGGQLVGLAVAPGSMLSRGQVVGSVLPLEGSSRVYGVSLSVSGFSVNRWPSRLGSMSLAGLLPSGDAMYSGYSDTGYIEFDGLYELDRRVLRDSGLAEYVILRSGDTVQVERFATGASTLIVWSGTPLESVVAGWGATGN